MKKEKYHISWERVKDHIMLTDTLFRNQLVFVEYHNRREIVLFDIVTGSIKPMPSFGKCICSGVIFKTELYVLIFENEDSDDNTELWWRPIYGCYKINLEDLVTWVLCKTINNHFQQLYRNMDSGNYGHVSRRYDNNYGEYPSLHKCGEDLFISSHHSFLSYNFKTDRARFFNTPEGYEKITAMAVVKQKIYICADYNHKLCEVKSSEGVYKDITLQENITDSPDYCYADMLSDISCDVQDINHLKVYRNRYILLNYSIHNFNLHLLKWRFLIYDTKLGTVDSSPFYRNNHDGSQICYGLWVEDSFFFHEYHRGKENSTTIFSIQEIIGNYKTIDTWILVKNLVDRKLVDLTTIEEGIEKSS